MNLARKSYELPSRPKFFLFAAIREKMREGYSRSDLKADLIAGLIVGMVAIPLGMALAIATGVPPQYGLYTVVFSGLVALLGGSRFNVSGPTAAFVVILAPIVGQYGLGGLLLASCMAGILLLILGLTRLGRVIHFVPYPVTTGFTSGIAVVIAVIQLKDFFGLKIEHMPDSFFERIRVLLHAAHTWSPAEFGIGLLTLVSLTLWPRINKRIPAPLVVMIAVSCGVALLNHFYPSLAITTIRDRFATTVNGVLIHGIPATLPHIDWPWNFSDASGKTLVLDFAIIQNLFPAALAIALLGAIESLLCAVVADGIAQTDHDPDSELVALGICNIICPFFCAIAATGAIARTATNLRFGARSPLAAVFHSIVVLFIIIFFSQYVSCLPMAALAALLIFVAYTMFDSKHFLHCLRVSPRSDLAVLLTCFALTVIFDMVIGVTFGILLASFLFIRHMSTVSRGEQWVGVHHKVFGDLAPEIMVYEIAGPLFFGAAEKAMESATIINPEIRTVIFNLESVPSIDLTGMIALESAILKLLGNGIAIRIAGAREQPTYVLKKSQVLRDHPDILCEGNLQEVLKATRLHILI